MAISCHLTAQEWQELERRNEAATLEMLAGDSLPTIVTSKAMKRMAKGAFKTLQDLSSSSKIKQNYAKSIQNPIISYDFLTWINDLGHLVASAIGLAHERVQGRQEAPTDAQAKALHAAAAATTDVTFYNILYLCLIFQHKYFILIHS